MDLILSVLPPLCILLVAVNYTFYSQLFLLRKEFGKLCIYSQALTRASETSMAI